MVIFLALGREPIGGAWFTAGLGLSRHPLEDQLLVVGFRRAIVRPHRKTHGWVMAGLRRNITIHQRRTSRLRLIFIGLPQDPMGELKG